MPEIKYLPEQRRFQIDIDGLEAGHIGYTEENGGWNVVHTEVSPNFRGRGIAKMLVDALMAHAEANGIPLNAIMPHALSAIRTKSSVEKNAMRQRPSEMYFSDGL